MKTAPGFGVACSVTALPASWLPVPGATVPGPVAKAVSVKVCGGAGRTVRPMVATFESALPSLALNVKLSGPL